VSFDVLEEAQSWLAVFDAGGDPGPEVSGVVLSLPFSGCGEWLAVVDDGAVGAVALVLFDGDVIDILNAARLVAPDVLPTVRAINFSGSISVRNDKEILVPLIDNSAFNCLGFCGLILSDGGNHSESSLR
jgi:hypothetical protein